MLTLLNECYSFGSNRNKKKYREMAAKRESCDGTSIDTSSGNPIIVSVLIPGEDSKKYLLAKCGDRGWWLPHGKVHKHEAIKVAAQRVATEVSNFVVLHFSSVGFFLLFRLTERLYIIVSGSRYSGTSRRNFKDFTLSRGYDE